MLEYCAGTKELHYFKTTQCNVILFSPFHYQKWEGGLIEKDGEVLLFSVVKMNSNKYNNKAIDSIEVSFSQYYFETRGN